MKFDLALFILLLAISTSDQQSVKDFERPFRVLEGLIIDKNFFLLRELTPEEKLSGNVDLDDPFNETKKLQLSVIPIPNVASKQNDEFTISKLFPSSDRAVFKNSQNLFRNKFTSESEQKLRKSSTRASNKKKEKTTLPSTARPSAINTPKLNVGRGKLRATGDRRTVPTSENKNQPIGSKRLRPISPTTVRKPIRTRTRRVQRIIKVIPAGPSGQAPNTPTRTSPISSSIGSNTAPTRSVSDSSGSISASSGSISASTGSFNAAPARLANGISISLVKKQTRQNVFGVSGSRPKQIKSSVFRGATAASNKNTQSFTIDSVLNGVRPSLAVTESSVPSFSSSSDVDFQSNEDSVRRLMKRLPGGSEKVLKTMSKTIFSCVGRPYGYYADMGSNCQVFHICSPVTHPDGYQENLRHSFFCNNGTIFDQQTLSCQDVDVAMDCHQAEKFYTAVPFFEKFNIFDRLRKEHEDNQERAARRVARRVSSSQNRVHATVNA